MIWRENDNEFIFKYYCYFRINKHYYIFLLILSPFLNKRYAIKWKYLMWMVIAVRLILPFHIDIPVPQMVIDIPTQITVPIDTNNEKVTPTMLPAEQKTP